MQMMIEQADYYTIYNTASVFASITIDEREIEAKKQKVPFFAPEMVTFKHTLYLDVYAHEPEVGEIFRGNVKL